MATPTGIHFHISHVGELSLSNFFDWCATVSISVLLAFTLLQFGGTRPDTLAIILPLLGIAVFFNLLTILAVDRKEPIRLNPVAFVFLPYLIYLCLNCALVSPFPWNGEEELIRMVMAITIFWIVCHGFRYRYQIRFVLLVLLVVATAQILAGITQTFHSPEWLPRFHSPLTEGPTVVKLSSEYHGRAAGFFETPGSFAALMLMAGAGTLLAGCSRRYSPITRMILIYLGAMMLSGVVLSISRGGMLLMVLGLYLMPFLARASGRTRIVSWLALTAGLGALTYLLMVSDGLIAERIRAFIDDGGETTRPVMWTAAWQQFLSAPILGNGVGSYEFLFEQYRPAGFSETPAHAHNDYLEILADQGLVGFLLLWVPVAAVLFIAAKAWLQQPDQVKLDVLDERKRRPLRMPTRKVWVGALGLALALFCLYLAVESHLSVSGLLFVFFLLLGFCAKLTRIPELKIPRRRPVILALFLGGTAMSIALPLWLYPNLIAHAYAQDGERRLQRLNSNPAKYKQDTAYFERMIERLREGTKRDPGNAEAWNNLSSGVAAQSALRPTQIAAFGAEAEKYARQAIQIHAEAPQAWINLGNALTLQSRQEEAGEAYQKATEIAPNNADTWHAYAIHLDRLDTTRPEALEAVERALALDPARTDSENLRKRILIP